MIEARARAGLTQQQLAERMHTTQAVIARLESGRVKPSTRTLERLAAATGMQLRISFEPTPASQAQVSQTSTELPEQFVIFLDFLGFSEATTSWDVERTLPLLDLLVGIAGSKSTFSVDGRAQEDGSYKIQIAPEITTFSDHIVASYHLFDRNIEAADLLFPFWLDMCLSEAQRIVSTIALKALQIGLLVRGGITLGKLYHANGVVFGEGMVNAYQLESRVASYPRVVVSSRVYSKLPEANRHRLRQDKDGIWHLNYLGRLTPQRAPSGEDRRNDILCWITSALETIEKNSRVLEAQEKWSELAKWAWFRAEFDELVVSRFA